MANRTIEAILKLSSKLGSMRAFNTLGDRLDKVDRKAKAYNRQQSAVTHGAHRMRGALLGSVSAAAITAGAAATAREFASVERRMNYIGITAEASGEKTEAALERVRQIADDVRAPVDNVVDGLDSLTAAGASMDEALELLPAVAKTAQAADAEYRAIATTGDAISNSFDIAAGDIESAFDIIAKGGKEGKFELKDMADYLPSLAPAFAALGYKGKDGLRKLVAALQTVRRETGTSGEAATAFMDVLTKMESQTITNNFSKFGVDLRDRLSEARKSGKDILDTFLDLAQEAVGGDLSKLPQLFTDKQMLIAMRAILRNRDAMKEYQAAVHDAAGTVNRDFELIAKDSQSKLDRIGNSWERLKQNIGGGLFDMGLGGGLDAVSTSMTRAQAINKTLDKRGMSWWEKRSWWARNGFDETDQANAAWQGGYRSAADRKTIEAYGDYAESRRAAPDRPVGEIPRPVPRPSPAIAATDDFSSDLRRQQVEADLAQRRRTFEPNAIEAKMRAGAGMNVLAGAEAKIGADDSAIAEGAAALKRSGDDAGRSISEAARKVNEAGSEAGSTFARMMDDAAERFGVAAARSFRENVGSVSAPSAPSSGSVSGVRGRTMPNAGATQTQSQ